MAPVNFLEYGKSYGSRLYGKTPSKYLMANFDINYKTEYLLQNKTFWQNKLRKAMSLCCLQLFPWKLRPGQH